MALVIKQHDRRPWLVASLQQDGGTPIDLTDATQVDVIVRKQGQTATVLREECEVTDAVLGEVRYKWAAGDTDTPGDYDVEWEILWDDVTDPQTVPTVGYYLVTIEDDLDVP